MTIKPSKVYIIGSVASGKTTFAKKLSKSLKVNWYELDNVIWERHAHGDIKRTSDQRDLLFNRIIDSEKWIIEDVCRPCFERGLSKADIIILLDIPSGKRKRYILKRWIKQKLRVEKSNYEPTIKMLKLMFKWCDDYDKTKSELLKRLEPFKDKVVILTSTRNHIL